MFKDAGQNNSHTNLSASSCPFCQKNNRCLMASASTVSERNSSVNGQSVCWCMTVEVPKGLRELARKRGFDEQCICRGCVGEFGKDREGFLLRNQ